ncbi:MAG TPA: STAS domain-containing protein [Desulfuromonadales bacterium]|nr:STAS domain-containing protein [Desulfuromonadales bacterium]
MIRISGTNAHLAGDWTLSGTTRNLSLLSHSLQQFEPGSGHSISVDCGEIKSVDASGAQLLNVWLQCFRYRGVEPKLVNVPEILRHFMQRLDCSQYQVR